MSVHFGPYDLLERAGQGGMGVVWRGRHRASGLDVAIKTLRPASARERAAFDAAMEHELRAIAALDHPRVVPVLDHGRTQPHDPIPGPDQPWLAMAWMAGGTLRQQMMSDWGAVQQVLDAVLEGLAWTHAHGILHRDVKPENVLSDGSPGGWALADFGLARLPGSADRHPGWGSPGYTAPEQRRRDDSALGPWTDLYAVGCLAWELVARTLPPRDRRFHPIMAVPPDLETWLAALLDPYPITRLQHAADARAWLAELSAPVVSAPRAPITTLMPSVPSAWSGQTVFSPEEDESDSSSPSRAPARRPPPMPDHPPHIDRPRQGITRLVRDAGLSLLDLRPIPLIGRASELHHLWTALRTVSQGTGARQITLVGPAGSGRSRLGRQLLLLARFSGAAEVISVTADGLEAALARTLFPAPPPIRPSMATADRIAWFRQLLRRLTRTRPALLWVDDAEEHPETLRLIQSLMRDGAESGIRLLALLAGNISPQGEVVTLSPLAEADRRALVEGVLGVDPSLAARIDEHAQGSPGLTVATVAALRAEGRLVPTPSGYALVGAGPLPTDASTAALARVTAAIRPEDLPLAELAAVGSEASAWVDLRDVAERAGYTGVSRVSTALLNAGLAHTLPHNPRRWLLSDGPARVALEARAAQSGRAVAHHAAWAEALQATQAPARLHARHLLGAGRDHDAVQALYDAMQQAGRDLDYGRSKYCIDAMMAAARRAKIPQTDPRLLRAHARLATALRQLGRLEDVADRLHEALAIPALPDTHRGHLLSELAAAQQSQGALDEALTNLTDAIALVDAASPNPLRRELRPKLRWLRANLHRSRGDLPNARADLEAARALATEPRWQNWIRWELGAVLTSFGYYAQALTEMTAALAAAKADNWIALRANALNSLGEIERLQGNLDQAAEWYRLAVTEERRTGWATVYVPELNLAAIDVERGHFSAARAGVTRAVASGWVRSRPPFLIYADLIDAVALIGLDAPAKAATALDRALERIQQTGLIEPDYAHLLEMFANLARPPLSERARVVAEHQRAALSASPEH